jgi:hypothetical protein
MVAVYTLSTITTHLWRFYFKFEGNYLLTWVELINGTLLSYPCYIDKNRTFQWKGRLRVVEF